MKVQRGKGERQDQQQAEEWQRQFERNYHAHLRGTSEGKRRARQARARSQRPGRYFWRVLLLAAFAVGALLGPQMAEPLQPACAAVAEWCRSWVPSEGSSGTAHGPEPISSW